MTDDSTVPGGELEPTPVGGGALDAGDEVIEAELIDDDEEPDEQGPQAQPEPEKETARLSRTAVVVLWVAGSLVAVLLLIALFLVGTRLSGLAAPTPMPTVTFSPTPTPTATTPAVGPLAPGTYAWDELLGGECLDPFESAWQQTYTVVDCGVPHPSQLVLRGELPDSHTTPYPGIEQLVTRMNLLCTAPTVINHYVTGEFTDIQVFSSVPVDEADWADGNRTYYCFLARSSGEPFTAPITVPEPVVG